MKVLENKIYFFLQAYLEQRAEAMQDVEQHIVELGQIFNRLATMIAEQKELVERYYC